MTRVRSEGGQAIPLMAVFMVAMLGMTAIVLDVGSWFRAHRATQAAADAAALAGAQALPYDTGRAAGWAVEFAGKNGGGLEPGGVTFSGTADTITVTLSRPAPGFFAKVFGIDSVTVRATASARVIPIGEPKWVAPIVVNEKHPMLTCQPKPCFGQSTVLEYHHLKANGPSDPDGAGSFGFINLTGNGNPGTSELRDQILHGFDKYMDVGTYDARTGNPFSAIKDVLDVRIGEEMLFPIYRKLTGTGSDAKYEIIGWVGFVITKMDLAGNNEKFYGYFTRVIWEGILSEDPTTPDFGVRIVALVE
jgi:Putative Flp pilus-assembly TadE/G-like